MARNLFRQIISETIAARRTDYNGQTVSKVYTTPFDTAGTEMTVVDVLMHSPTGIVVASSVPIAANNQVMLHAAMGSPVLLRRSLTGRVEVVGLDKRAVGEVRNFSLNIGLGSTSAGTIDLLVPRNVTLGGLASANSAGVSGFGLTPLEAIALVSSDDSFVRIGWP